MKRTVFLIFVLVVILSLIPYAVMADGDFNETECKMVVAPHVRTFFNENVFAAVKEYQTLPFCFPPKP